MTRKKEQIMNIKPIIIKYKNDKTCLQNYTGEKSFIVVGGLYTFHLKVLKALNRATKVISRWFTNTSEIELVFQQEICLINIC